MRKLIFGTLIAFVVVGLTFMLENSLRKNQPPKTLSDSTDAKQLSSELQVRDIATRKVSSIDQFKDNVWIINFWATWCEACIAEMPSLVALQEKYKNTNFKLILVNVDDEPSKAVPKMLEKLKITFPVYEDVDGAMSRRFQVSAIPHSVFIGKNLKMLWSESGERDWFTDEIFKAIDEGLK